MSCYSVVNTLFDLCFREPLYTLKVSVLAKVVVNVVMNYSETTTLKSVNVIPMLEHILLSAGICQQNDAPVGRKRMSA